MRTITKFYQPGPGGGGGVVPMGDPFTTALAAGQAILGGAQMISGANRAARYRQQRQAYETPEEFFQILNASTNRATGGFDPLTFDYLTNQTDRAFASSAGVAKRLGANANDLSALFDQKMQGIMRIGSDNARLNMENFSKYIDALDLIGNNRAAEWSSQQDILKDNMQAAAADKAAGLQNITGAANAIISNRASARTANLYSAQPVTPTVAANTNPIPTFKYEGTEFNPGGRYSAPNQNIMDFFGYKPG